ncbi:hypothetical protein CEXT_815671 [Caerostris extrusa]|uniref:Uncharacterized protein n=1 Tax=Caerostris extrusa TaxID=172846 RepID=A0AAV4U861_CAEEX|nr:hypothetical protein CEXT_815671 [Caerostris extrusa]
MANHILGRIPSSWDRRYLVVIGMKQNSFQRVPTLFLDPRRFQSDAGVALKDFFNTRTFSQRTKESCMHFIPIEFNTNGFEVAALEQLL